ncbi:MAG: RpiB/LacA/LacB family sugar-phosphate isomerase [Patescibacteria group bacterium]
MKKMLIYIGADHAGFEKKEKLKAALEKLHYSVVDMGAKEKNDSDDYPIIAKKVALAMKKSKGAQGILLCGSGQGVCIAANRIKGIRAAVAWNPQSAAASRNDDDANILCLGARFFTSTQLLTIILCWLKTPFSKLSRHKRRIRLIDTFPAR